MIVQEQRVIAIAADYADALLVARRAKRTMLLLLLLILFVQLAVFALAQWTQVLSPASTEAATTQTGLAAANWPQWLHYLAVLSLYGGIIFSIVLVLTLFLTVHVMLVGRLIGVSHVTRAFVLSILLALLMFPWQSLLATSDLGRRDMVLPGVLYTWREVEERVPMQETATEKKVLYWGRFLAMPIVALMLLLVIQQRSGRGLKLALGEEEILPPTMDDMVTTTVR